MKRVYCSLIGLSFALGIIWVPSVAASFRETGKTPSQTRVQDENILLRQLLLKNGRYAAYAGIEKDKGIVDPDSTTLRVLTAAFPNLRPASEIAAGSKSLPRTLVTVSVIRWKNKNTVEARAVRHSTTGRFCSQLYTAARNTPTSTQWTFRTGIVGCGFWNKVTIQTANGPRIFSLTTGNFEGKEERQDLIKQYSL